MSALEQALGGPAIEVVAKATRRQFTLEYERKIVREADGCKTPGALGALLRREGLRSPRCGRGLVAASDWSRSPPTLGPHRGVGPPVGKPRQDEPAGSGRAWTTRRTGVFLRGRGSSGPGGVAAPPLDLR